VRSLLTRLARVEVPPSAVVTEPRSDGTAAIRVVLSSLDTRPLVASNNDLQTVARELARWRDCRRADIAQMTTVAVDWREPVVPPAEPCSASGSYSDQELTELRLKCYPPVPLVELRPSRPIPPECEITVAMQDVPVALTESRFGGRTIHLPADPSEHRLAMAAWLAFAEEQGHGRAAAEWAIYRLAEAGRLRVVWPRVYLNLRSEVAAQWMADQAARYRGGRAATVTDWDLFEDGRILELRSTTALWAWYQDGCLPSPAACGGSPNPESIPGTAQGGKSEPPLAETRTAESGQPNPNDQPDGPFEADGFRFFGVEVRFGRAALQRRLVLALWDAENNRPTDPRPIEDVLAEVWGEEHDTTDSAFRQLCTDTRTRFQKENCPLDIKPLLGTVQLVRV
jgi:hypothetical protein